METKDLNSWEEFVGEVAGLRRFDPQKTPLGELIQQSAFLFRGQANAAWKLENTLERASDLLRALPWSMARYHSAMSRVQPAIAAHTGKRWELAPKPHYDRWASHFDSVGSHLPWRDYEFMAYLRHHGFPSPLLDWSRSPYVAAFFAFLSEAQGAEQVAIYAYREDAGRGKVFSGDKPRIVQLSEYTSTHARHFRQQCQYTACVQWDKDCTDYLTVQNHAGGFVYASHQEVFENSIAGQDQLWRFTLPTSLRAQVLNYLNEFNLNAYSLFGSEDSLVQTLAAQELR